MDSSENIIKQGLGRPIQQMTVDFLQHLQADENLFFSPFSITSALSMVLLGADGNTLAQMRKTLRFAKGTDDFQNAFKQYHGFLKNAYQPFTLRAADRVYPSKSYAISAEFLTKCEEIFSVTIKAVDFNMAEEVRKEINQWVESETNGKIKELLPSESIGTDTAMVLVDAIYFKSDWKYQFKTENTKKMAFRSGKRSIEVDMMYQKKPFRYKQYSRHRFAALELPYIGNTLTQPLSMLILLPDKNDGLKRLEKNLTTGLIDDISDSMPFKKVMVWLPKFKLQWKNELSQPLSSLGMSDAFSDKANFSKMSPAPSNGLRIGKVFHESFVEVNEEGTEAAAATGVLMVPKCRGYKPPEFKFKADHPFIFFIKDVQNDVILFAGRLTDPLDTEGKGAEYQGAQRPHCVTM